MFRTFIVAVCPLIIFPYVSRILGDEGVGEVQFVQSIATYFQLFATFGITSYGIREGAKVRDNKEKLGKLVSELFIINCFTTLLSLLIYSFTFSLPKLADYRALLIVFAAYIVFYGMNLDWFFNVTEEYSYITIRTTIFQLLAVTIMFLIVRERKDVIGYALVLVFPYIGTFFANLFGIKKEIRLFREYQLEVLRHIPGLILLFSIIASSSIYSLLDTTMLGFMKGDSAVGQYSAASKLTRLIVQLTGALCTVFVPRLSYYLGSKQKKLYQELAVQSSNIISIVAIPCSIGLLVFSEQAILIYSGKEFIDANIAMKILAINLFFSAIDSFLGWQILVPNNKDKTLFIATLIGAAVNAILNYACIPVWGINGAAFATLLAELAVFFICVFSARAFIRLSPIFIHCLKCIVASLPIFLIGWGLGKMDFSAVVNLLIAVPVSGIFYLLILGGTKEQIVIEIFELIRKKLRRL